MWLTYKQAGFSEGAELPLRFFSLAGATLYSDKATEEGGSTLRKIGLELGDGNDARCVGVWGVVGEGGGGVRGDG